MSKYFLAGFLIVFGFSLLIAIGIPTWVSGILAIAAGLLILVDR
jgi:hypothetical protein